MTKNEYLNWKLFVYGIFGSILIPVICTLSASYLAIILHSILLSYPEIIILEIFINTSNDANIVVTMVGIISSNIITGFAIGYIIEISVKINKSTKGNDCLIH